MTNNNPPVPEQPLGSDYIDPRSLENIPDQVGRFCEVVAQQVTEPRSIPLSDIVATQRGSDKLWSQASVDVVAGLIDGQPYGRLYVDGDTETSELHGNTQHVRLARTSVAETSAHNVFFAKMLGYNGGSRVAVKPHENGTERLITEWVNTTIARNLGFGAFETLGIIRTREGGYILTKRRDDVEPLDNSEWAGILNDTEANKAMIEDLTQVGPLLARLHDVGGFHCDPQLKNFVVTEQGTLDFIDWESGKFYDKPSWGEMEYTQEEQLLSGAQRDLKILFGSLARSLEMHGVGLLDGYTTSAQWSLFKQYVLNPYIEERMKLIENAGHADIDRALTHLTEIEEELENYILDGEMYKTLSRNGDHEEAA